jgi:hypothetical protein
MRSSAPVEGVDPIITGRSPANYQNRSLRHLAHPPSPSCPRSREANLSSNESNRFAVELLADPLTDRFALEMTQWHKSR